MGDYEVGMITQKNINNIVPTFNNGNAIGIIPQSKIGYNGDPSLMPRNMKL